MSETLTHSQLLCLEEQAGPMFGAEAAAEIRELRGENQRLKRAVRMVRQATSLWQEPDDE